MSSEHRRIVWQIAIVACLTLLGKAGAFAKDVLLSLLFGAGMETDAYFIANAIPGFVFAGVFSTIGLVFLPIYSRAQTSPDGDGLSIIKTATIIYLGLALIISILTIVFAGVLVPLIAGSASQEVQTLAIFLTRVFAVGFVFSGWVGLQNAILQAHKAFVWPMAVPVFNHMVVILGLLVTPFFGGKIYIVTYSAVLGWMLLSPIARWFSRRYYQWSAKARFSKDTARQLVFLSIPVFLSISLDQINTIIDLTLGSGFGEGAVSHLTYASRLVILLSGLFSILISYFIFPYLADSLAKQDFAQSQKLLTRGLGGMIILTMPLAIFCAFRSEALISLVFQRGAFSIQDTEVTACVLRYYAIGMLFASAREVFNRVFLASQRVKSILAFGVISAGVNVLTSLYFMNQIGLAGIALGTACGAIVYVSLQIFTLLRTSRHILSWWPLAYLGLSLVAGYAMVQALNFYPQITVLGTEGLGFLLNSLLALGTYFAVVLAGVGLLTRLFLRKA